MTARTFIAFAALAGAWPAAAETPAAGPAAPVIATGLVDPSAEVLSLEAERHSRLTMPVMVEGTGPFAFMIDTGSPYTFLSHTAMAALIGGAGANVPVALRLDVHGARSMVCYLSPRDKHFADINLLGTDFLETRRAQQTLRTAAPSRTRSQTGVP